MVLWCIDRRSRRYPAFANAPGFTVSILASGHQDVSSRLAGAGEHNLDGIALIATELGPPALADSLAVFECALESVQDAGDHAILISVLRFAQHDGAGAPLVYYQGKYGHGLAQSWSAAFSQRFLSIHERHFVRNANPLPHPRRPSSQPSWNRHGTVAAHCDCAPHGTEAVGLTE